MLDQEDIDRLREAENNPSKFVVRGVTAEQKLGWITVVCFVLNRTIGSGIFVLPSTILQGTGTIGGALLLWVFGGVMSIAALLVWLTFARTIPRFEVGGQELEYVYRSPKFLTTCLIAVLYVALDNLSGNAIAFGRYLTKAVGHDPDDPNSEGLVIGLAIAAMTLSCLLHAVWRKGGILLNNAFAVMKVAILLMIIILGIVKLKGPPTINPDNFDTKTSFSGPQLGISSYATSMLYAYYPYTGFVQPFYVLAEVRNPRGSFTKATIGTMMAIFVMYLLVNIAFFAVVPKSAIMSPDSDIATLFFQNIFESAVATQIIAGFIAINILGNIIVMTFVAARVKQEIAKEGVLPFSRFFASNSTTLVAKLGDTLSPKKVDRDTDELEQSPVGALFLHWLVSIIMIAVAAGVADGTKVVDSTKVAYDVLVDLYTYVIALLVSFFVSIGLLYLMFRDRRAWAEMCGFHPWGGPSSAILVALSTGFLIVTVFLALDTGSPYAYAIEGFEWFIPPAVGLGTFLLGLIYWIVFRFVVPAVKGKQLVVDRVPIIVSDDHGGWVQKLEIVEFSWGVMHERINEDDDSGVEK